MRQPVLRRRQAIGGGAGATLLWATGAHAQSVPTINTLVPNVTVSGKLRDIVEQEAHVKLNDEPFQSTPDAIARLLAPGGTQRYNLMLAQADFARLPVLGPRAGTEKVAELDLAKITNAADIADDFKKDIISRDGKVFGLPYFIGYDSVVYNTDAVPADDPYIDSWGMIFEDKYAGRIGWFDTASQMITAAALYLGNPAPATMTVAEVNEVGRFLIAKKKNVRTFWQTFAQGAALLASGEIVCTYGAIPIRVGLQQQGGHFTNAWPKEGVLSFVADLFIPKDCANLEASQAVLNAMMGPPYIDQLGPVSGYLPTNKKAGADLTHEQKLRAGYGVLTGETKHVTQALPERLNAWVEVWSKVKSS